MKSALISEFRKLLSVRMTYIVTLIGLLVTGGLVSFYSAGYGSAELNSQNPRFIEEVVLGNAGAMAVFICVVSLLMITHEYRYNTIMHTLTGTNSRVKAFFAKLIMIWTFTVAATVLVSVLGPVLALIGMNLKGYSLEASQNIPYLDLAWRSLYYSFGMATLASIISFIVRNQVGAIITFFIALNTVEGLAGLLLKENVKYLPFTSLQYVVNIGQDFAEEGAEMVSHALTPGVAFAVSGIYLVIGLLIALLLFMRRDAN